MTTITTKTRLTALALAAVALTSTLTAAEARGFAGVARVAPHPATIVRAAAQGGLGNQANQGIARAASHVAAFRPAVPQGMPRLPVTSTCELSNCAPAPVGHKPPPPPSGDPGGPQPGPIGPGGDDGGGAGGGDQHICMGDRDCGIFRQD
jgi:hypothetical protein